MSNIARINPEKGRQSRNAKTLLRSACQVIENLDNRVEGCALVAWDARGATAGFVMRGGPISIDLLPTFVTSILGETCSR